MKPLEHEYNKNGFTYNLIQRTNEVAMYSQKFEGIIIAYEVFVITKQKANIIFGNQLEEKELHAPSSAWGTEAFTCTTLERAELRFNDLKKLVIDRNALPKQAD